VSWRASYIEPGRAVLTHEAASYDACLSWVRGLCAVRAAPAGATVQLAGPSGGTRRLSVRGGDGIPVTFRTIEE